MLQVNTLFGLYEIGEFCLMCDRKHGVRIIECCFLHDAAQCSSAVFTCRFVFETAKLSNCTCIKPRPHRRRRQEVGFRRCVAGFDVFYTVLSCTWLQIQETRLPLRGRAMPHIVKKFAKSLEVVQGHSKLH